MKTLGTLALALSLALGPVALASAQDGGVAAPRSGAPQPGAHGHHGRGHHGHRGMRGDPAARVEHRARMLTAILDLDARQQAQVREILTQSAAEAQALRSAAGPQQPPSEEGRAAMQALRQRTEQRIDAVLSASQRATIARVRAVREQDMQERRARREQHRAEHGARGATR